MKRLALVALALATAAWLHPSHEPAPVRAPVDGRSLNVFIKHYNRYVDELMAGKVDVPEWAKAEKAWRELR